MKKILCFVFALMLLAGLMITPVDVNAASTSPIPNDDIEMGDMIFRAYYEKKAAEAFEEGNLDDFAFHYRLVDSEVFSDQYVELGGIWDRDYLYLAYELQEGYPDPEITINNIEVSEMEVKETDTHVMVKIPLASVKAYIAAFGNTYAMKITLDDLYWEGHVMFTKRQSSVFKYDSKETVFEYTEWKDDAGKVYPHPYTSVKKGNNIYFKSESNLVGNWPVPSPNAVFGQQDILFSADSDVPIILEFDFQSPVVPVDNSDSPIQGLEVAVMDETGEGKSDKRQGILLFVTSKGDDKDITLVAHRDKGRYGTGIANDSNAKLHFRVEIYNDYAYCNSSTDFNNCGIRVYVNGLLALEQEDVKTPNGGITLGTNSVSFAGHMDGTNPMDISVTNIELYREIEASARLGSVDSVEFSHLLGENANENAITSDMTLIKYLPDGQINGTVIDWVSSDEAIISKDGKVTAPAEDTVVQLKAVVRSTGESKTFQVTVKKAAPVLIPGTDGNMDWIYIAAGAVVLVVVVVVVIVVASKKSKKKKVTTEE